MGAIGSPFAETNNMPSKAPSPISLVDCAVADAVNGSIVVEMDSYGATIRVCLSPSVAGPLAASLSKAAKLAVEQRTQCCEVIPFPTSG